MRSRSSTFVLAATFSFALGCGAQTGEEGSGSGAGTGNLGSGGSGAAQGNGSGPGNGGQGNGSGNGSGAGGTFSVDFPDPKAPMGTGGLGGDKCAAEVAEAKPVPLDLYVLLDRSGSMTKESDLWTPVTDAILSFIQSPNILGVGVGLQYFPRNGTAKQLEPVCTTENYTTPAVPIGDLPGNAPLLKASIDAHHFTKADWDLPTHSKTPTRYVAAAAVAHLTARAATHPERRAAILLATDGEPSGCSNSNVDDVAKELAKAAALNPPIRTFVIGIGAISNLNKFAVGGGTGPQAIVVDKEGGQKTRDEFLAALEQIRKAALPCSYIIPNTTNIDPTKVNVSVTNADNTVTDLGKVANAAACASTNAPAWHYDNEAAPKAVVICPSSCSRFQQVSQNIQLAFGCASRKVL